MPLGLVIFTCLLVFFNNVNAEIYKWIDDNGQVHFGSKPSQNTNATAINLPKQPRQKSVTKKQTTITRPTPPVYKNQSPSQWAREGAEFKKQWNRYQQQSNDTMVQNALKQSSQRAEEDNKRRLADEKKNRLAIEKSLEQNRLSSDNSAYKQKLEQVNKKRISDLNKFKRKQRKERKRQKLIDKYWR